MPRRTGPAESSGGTHRDLRDGWRADEGTPSAPPLAGRPALLNGREEFAGRDGGAFFGGDREDAAGAVGLQLVLHLHGFHYDDALTGDHLVAGGGEDADYFAGH